MRNEIKDEGGVTEFREGKHLSSYKPIIASDGEAYRIFAVMACATSDPDGDYTYFVTSEDEKSDPCYANCHGEEGEVYEVLLRKSKGATEFVSIECDTHHLLELFVTKVCAKCNKEKTGSEFSKDKCAKGGLNSQCKSCNSAYYKSRHPLQNVFRDMRSRCYNPNNKGYPMYGGRGITICEEWLEGRSLFIEWAKSNGYEKGLQIDRMDNDLGYNPSNCHFVTGKANVQNQSTSKWWHIEGIRYDSCRDAAKALGVGYQTIVNWCEGCTDNGQSRPPKPNCYSELKYKQTLH